MVSDLVSECADPQFPICKLNPVKPSDSTPKAELEALANSGPERYDNPCSLGCPPSAGWITGVEDGRNQRGGIMFSEIAGFIGGLFGLGKQWVEGKQKIAEALVERETKALTNEADWDKVQAEAGKNSWKDEWLTLLVSIPMIMAFIPGAEEYVLRGFAALESMPEWYQYLVGVVFAASFGIKALASKFKMGKG